MSLEVVQEFVKKNYRLYLYFFIYFIGSGESFKVCKWEDGRRF